ncbi:MAG: ABC transporter ATP-binding protein [Clostridiaceae bacterium]
MDRLLDVKKLGVSYNTWKGKVRAVRDVEFHLDRKETLTIVGESGCGKTAAVKALMRLIGDPSGEIEESSGIFFEGRDVLAMNKKELMKLRGGDIGMIFQDPMASLNPTMKIGDQIAESLIIHRKMNKKDALAEACEMLRQVDIPDAALMARKYPHEFSGGMRQRVMIAIALACRPKILIADEPTTALDVTVQAQILERMGELQKRLGTAVILITHDLGIAAGNSDRIHIMYAGQIVERARTEELFSNPAHPYTRALLHSIPRLDSEHKSELYSLAGSPPDLMYSIEGCPFSPRCGYCEDICRERLPENVKISETHQVMCWKAMRELGGGAV